VTDVTEILVHWYAGRSQSEVATSLGVDRKTIKKYVTPAIDAGHHPRWAGDDLRGLGRIDRAADRAAP
jgi:predicted transcriptional regulator